MNEYDSTLVGSILCGSQPVPSPETADVVLINTCAVRENAHRKIWGRLDTLRPIKRIRQQANLPFIVGILGCMAQNLKEQLFSHPVVNLVVGPDNYKALPSLIAETIQSDGRQMMASLSEHETYDDIIPKQTGGVSAQVTIMRGCDNFCTFCVVPYTRGRERSRPVESVVQEVQSLAERGYKQVTLLGQNVNSYRHGGLTFSDLMLQVADVPGIRRVMFMSPHPKDFPDALLEAIAGHPHICKHVHLPLQAGSDRILGLMNRTYTQKEYLLLARRIRSRVPNVALTTDMIVGFPTETDADYKETVAVATECQFDKSFIFKYSERKGTVAARDYPDDVPPEVKTHRIMQLIEQQRQISFQKNRACVGTLQTVFVEESDEKRLGYQIGKTGGHTTVLFPAPPFPLPLGSLVPVRMTSATANTLYGELEG